MSNEKAIELLEKCSEVMNGISVSDLPALSNLHTDFQDLEKEIDDITGKDIARQSSDIVENLVMDEIKDKDDAITDLVNIVDNLLNMLVGGELDISAIPKRFNIAEQAKEEVEEVAEVAEEESEEDAGAVIIKEIAEAVDMDSSLVADFCAESTEHLDISDESLLTIENAPDDMEAINCVFRAFHTIKGVAGFLNLVTLKEVAHYAENLLDYARDEKIQLIDKAIDLTFESVDMLKGMVGDIASALEEEPTCSTLTYGKLISDLKAYIEAVDNGTNLEEEVKPVVVKPKEIVVEDAPVVEESGLPIEVIQAEIPRFIQEVEDHLENCDEILLILEKEKENDDAINSLFRSFHTIKGSAGFLTLQTFEKISHEAENILDKARSKKIVLTDQMLEAFFKSIDIIKTMNNELKKQLENGEFDLSKKPENYDEMIQVLQDLSNGKNAKLDTEEIKKDTEIIVKDTPKSVPENKPVSIKKEKPHVVAKKQQQNAVKKAVIKETVKVDSDRLDKLVDTIGELVIAETMILQSQELAGVKTPMLETNLTHLDKITRELQEMGTSLRMVPVRSVFQKMARLVRDLSKKMGKNIEFVMSGEDTELDKTVVDKIGDPLVHMVRNSIDHGIEPTSEERLKNGKPEKATVQLKAFHKGGSIHIEIVDDGRGINKDIVLKKAIENGIVSEDDDLSDREIHNLIFAAGFSTAAAVTEVSGRGVGMDVVRKNIEGLRGQVDIQSEMGKGSTFTIKLPLTLAIIDGMVISAAKEKYIIPTLTIVTSVQVKKDTIKSVQGRGKLLELQEELVPIFSLNDLFELGGIDGKEKDECLIVIIEDDGKKIGLIVDELLGQQQIVIKNLGEYLKNVPGLSGGAIMPDGNVGLILDVSSLVKLAK